MNRLLIFVALIFSMHNIRAQIQNAQFEIGNKTIQFSIEEELSVWRTVSDTVIKCKGNKFKPFGLVPNTEFRLIPKSEFKFLHREVFNEHGCIWTRLTNDVIRTEDGSEGLRQTLTFLYDSVNVVPRSRGCWRIDTIMQINPVTLKEEQVVQINSDSRVKFNLGKVSKHELVDAVQNQFGLGKSNLNLHLKYIDMWILTETCGWLSIDYRNAESVVSATKKIEGIKSGSKIILEDIRLENTRGRYFEHDWYEFAVMTLVE